MIKKKKSINTGLALVLALLMVFGMFSSAGLKALAEEPEGDLALEQIELNEEELEAEEEEPQGGEEGQETEEEKAVDEEEEPGPDGNDGAGEVAGDDEETEAAEEDEVELDIPEDESTSDDDETDDENNEAKAGEKLAVEEAEEASGEEETSFMTRFTFDGLSSDDQTYTYIEVWDGRGKDSLDCDKAGDGGRPDDGSGWIHWIFSTKGDSTSAELVLGGTGNGTYTGAEATEEGGQAKVWHFYTPYFEVDGLTATIYLYGGAKGPGGGLVLSDYCPGGTFERLAVSKTAVTSYTREHFWDIDKKVETEKGYELDDVAKIWLYIDGSGDEKATWTVDVTYDGYQDRDFNVSGTITIKNTGTLDAVITSIDDVLVGRTIDIVCGIEFPYTLPVGQTLTCTYSEDGYVDGRNVVTVTTQMDTYSADAPVIWGDPTTEVNKTVNITDSMFGDLGTATAPDNAKFTYTKDFAWADFGAEDCGSYQYDNTATIVETKQSATATLKVNVQCFIYETAYAKGDDAICFIPNFSNWGWTNPIEPGEYTWDLWAGAGQCDTSKGTLVGSVEVVYDDGTGAVTVIFNVDEDKYDLGKTHVYADYGMFPQRPMGRGGKQTYTVAPGQYYNASPFDGKQVYVIAHAEVGMPDPDFGP